MIGWSIPIVWALRVGAAWTYISGRLVTSRLRPTSASSVSRQARSRKAPDMVVSSASKPLSLRSATSAPLSAGCSHARELMSVSTTRERAGFYSPDAMDGP